MLTKKSLAQLSNFQGCHLFSLLLKSFFSTLTTQQSSIEKVELFQGTNKFFSSLSRPSCFWVTDGRRWRSRASGWKGWSYLQVGEKMLTLLWKTTPDIQFNITNIWDALYCPEVWIMLICLMAFYFLYLIFFTQPM